MKLSSDDKIKIEKISEEMSMPKEVVIKAIESQYEFIRKKTKELHFDPNLTREEFDAMKTNFNIPCIGKLYASFYMYRKMNENARKRNKE
jgi:hypothetical protein|tara:strand:- start:481 stop:750 length:270 start_codon:yes stop_codon:yes gene_type:complete